MLEPSNDLTPKQRRVVLVVVAFTLMMVVSAVSGLNVALPSLARETGASQRDLQWIVDAYTVVFAGLLLPAGALGDRYGRKGTLLAGVAIFGSAAGVAIFAHSPGMLIALRCLMGIGAAAVMPTTLSIITTSFPEEERARAVGVWVGVVGGGAVIGLIGSGILLEFFNWSSFFVLNVALALIGFSGTLAFVPKSVDAHPPRLDFVGAIFSLVGVSALVYAIIDGPDRGWGDPLIVGAFVVAVLAIISFIQWELRLAEPMLDPRLFKLRGFGTGSLSLTMQFFAAFGFFFTILQYLQFVADFSALKAALTLLPMPLIMVPLARQAPLFARKVGLNRLASGGLVLMAIGSLIFSQLQVSFVYWHFLVGLVFFAAGIALAGTPATTAIVSSLPETKQGVASAVNDTSRELGSAIGIAILGSVLNARYRSGIADALIHLPARVADGARGSIAFLQSDVISRLGPSGVHLVNVAKSSFVDGVSRAFIVAAGVLLITAVYVVVRAPKRDFTGLS